MCSVYEHNKNILTSSIFNDATIFHDIAKKKKKKKKKKKNKDWIFLSF